MTANRDCSDRPYRVMIVARMVQNVEGRPLWALLGQPDSKAHIIKKVIRRS